MLVLRKMTNKNADSQLRLGVVVKRVWDLGDLCETKGVDQR